MIFRPPPLAGDEGWGGAVGGSYGIISFGFVFRTLENPLVPYFIKM